MIEDHSFALCLTHDVDRPYKTYQSIYYTIRERRLSHLSDMLWGRNPYWQFEEIMEIEADLGVRSAFYFLNEPHILAKSPRAWSRPNNWVQHLGRYDVRDPKMAELIHRLDAGGWEVGLHGSTEAADDPDRLGHEKAVLEEIIGKPVTGGRQHYLQLDIPTTWHHYAQIGLQYDASLGSGQSNGFQHGYRPLRPFGDDFVVFPLTLMDQTLPDPASEFDTAVAVCFDLLEEAAANEAVMSILWHPRLFSERDFPGYRRVYRRLLEAAQDMNAWIGTPRECYRALDLEASCTTDFDARDEDAGKKVNIPK